MGQRERHFSWTAALMIVSYVLGGLAVLCFVAGIKGIPFPPARKRTLATAPAGAGAHRRSSFRSAQGEPELLISHGHGPVVEGVSRLDAWTTGPPVSAPGICQLMWRLGDSTGTATERLRGGYGPLRIWRWSTGVNRRSFVEHVCLRTDHRIRGVLRSRSSDFQMPELPSTGMDIPKCRWTFMSNSMRPSSHTSRWQRLLPLCYLR